jgi:pilin isopeptide linkage protein
LASEGTIEISGRALITGNTATDDGGGIYLATGGTLATLYEIQITENTAGRNGGGIYTPYENLANIQVGENATFSGNRAAQSHQIDPADIPLHDAHILTHNFSDGFQYGYNNFDIAYNSGNPTVSVAITAQKTASGKTLEAGQFTFGLLDDSGELLSTVTNDADGNITFPAIPFDDVGTYSYTVYEITQSGGGWTIDQHRLPVTVTVSMNEQEQLLADVAYGGDRIFRNAYRAAPVNVTLRATKNATGATLEAGQFTFELTDDSSGHKTFASNDLHGNVTFPAIPFDEAGTYDYRIREISPSGGGWTTDTHIVPVIITITDNRGNLSANVTYPNGQPIFQNTYNPAPVGVILQAVVRVIGAEAPAYHFDFGLFEHPKVMLNTARRIDPRLSDEPGVLIATASNDAEGNVVFPPLMFTMAQIGTHDYTIREISPSGEGWIVDGHVYPVTVTVSDTGRGELVAVVDYPEGEPVFTNTYQTASATAQIQASKWVCGCCCLCAGWFSFGLFDSAGGRVAIAANDGNGNILFALPFDTAGEYTYTLRELDSGTRCWKLDKRQYKVTVTVADNGQGVLAATVTYGGGKAPTFANFYTF